MERKQGYVQKEQGRKKKWALNTGMTYRNDKVHKRFRAITCHKQTKHLPQIPITDKTLVDMVKVEQQTPTRERVQKEQPTKVPLVKWLNG